MSHDPAASVVSPVAAPVTLEALEATRASSRNAARRVLTLSTVAFTLLFAVWLMLGVLAIPIRKELGLSAVQFAWLTAIAVLSGSLLRLPAGVLADKIGGRRAMTLTLLLCVAPCALLSFVHSFGAAIVCALFFGLAGNSFAVGIAWNAAWFERERQGTALGTFGAGNVGASVTKLIGPALIAVMPAGGLLGGAIPGGWRFIPIVYAALLVAMAAVVWWVAPSNDRTPGATRTWKSMAKPLADIRVWRFGVYYVVVFGAYVAFSLWLPSYYNRVFGLSLAKASMLTALFVFPASLLRPVGGWLSDRYGARPVTYAVFGAMLAAAIPLALPSGALGFTMTPAIFFALVEVLGIGMGIGKASVYKYIPEYFPGNVGLVGGLVGTLGALGGFFLPLSFGYLEAAVGRPEICFAVMAALTAGSFAWLHLVVTGIKRRETQGDAADLLVAGH